MAGSRNTDRTHAQKRRLTTLGSLQVFPLGPATRETIQETTRASHVEPMTTQRNESDSVERERESHLKIPRSVRRTRASIFPQQASNLLTSTRRHTRFPPSPDHSRIALGQISTRQQSLRLLSVCLQHSPRRLSRRAVPKSIQRASTTLLWGDGSSDELPVRARHITPKYLTTGTS